MNKEEYQRLVKKYTPSEDKLKNALIAFVVGGLIGVLSCFIFNLLLKFNVSSKDANIWTLLILILTSSICTGLGFFDTWVSKSRCGLIIPITGFAHSVTSSSLEYKKDGLITGLGANVFKLAGSVLLYGIISAFILTIIKKKKKFYVSTHYISFFMISEYLRGYF